MHYGQNYLKRRRSLRDTFDLVAPHAMRHVKNQIENLKYTSFTFRDVFTMKSWFALVSFDRILLFMHLLSTLIIINNVTAKMNIYQATW